MVGVVVIVVVVVVVKVLACCDNVSPTHTGSYPATIVPIKAVKSLLVEMTALLLGLLLDEVLQLHLHPCHCPHQH